MAPPLRCASSGGGAAAACPANCCRGRHAAAARGGVLWPRGLPSSIADVPGPRPDADALIAAMGHDKKVADGKINFVLVKGLGHAFVTNQVPLAALRDVLTA